MNTDRPYWDMEIEPLFNTPDMAKIQLDKLKKILGRLKANAPFYTRQFEEFNLDPEKIRTFGIMISDKQEGAFRVEIDSISAFRFNLVPGINSSI